MVSRVLSDIEVAGLDLQELTVDPLSSKAGMSGCAARIVLIYVAGVDYRYELRRRDEVVATGHLNNEQSLEVGDRIQIGGQAGVVRTVEP